MILKEDVTMPASLTIIADVFPEFVVFSLFSLLLPGWNLLPDGFSKSGSQSSFRPTDSGSAYVFLRRELVCSCAK